MKKIPYIIVSLILALSCSNDMESFSEESNQSNKFGIAVAAESHTTRADITLSYDDLNEVGLYGYCTTQSATIMDNALFTKSTSGEWEYVGTDAPTWSYESPTDYFSFYGYSPYNADTSSDTSSVIASDNNLSISYDMTTDDYDLLLARKTEILRPAGGMVSLTFKHALAAIKVDVSALSNVDSVTLSGVLISSGSVSLSDSDDVTWILDTDTTQSCEIEVPIETDQYLMVIPQTFDDLTLTISFTDDTADDERTISASEWKKSVIYSYVISSNSSTPEGIEDNVIVVGDVEDADGDGSTTDDIVEYITSVLGTSSGEYTYFVIEGDVSADLIDEILKIETDDGFFVTGLDLSNADISSLASGEEGDTSTGDGTDLYDYNGELNSSAWENITTLVLPSTITSVDKKTNEMFKEDNGVIWDTIEVLDMSATGVTTLGDDCFKDFNNNNSLRVIILPKKLTTINKSFTNMYTLEEVYYWENNVTVVAEAFKGCSKLYDVYYYGADAVANVNSKAYQNSVTTHRYQTYYYDDKGEIQFKERTE